MSCRRGVPKNDCSCCKSLAEKVRELWERAANAIKSINGIQADGANNFDILPGAGIQVNPRANGIEIVATGATPEGVVQSVNGETPDEDGNVEIDTGLLTVNTIAPDADGDFSITAGSGIEITEDQNGIEISASLNPEEWDGPYLTGNALNAFFDADGNLTHDVVIGFNVTTPSGYTYTPIGGSTLFPKGTNEYTLINFVGVYPTSMVCYYRTTLHNLRTRNDSAFFYGTGHYLNLNNTSGSGIYQTLDIKMISMSSADGGYQIYIKKAIE